MEQKTKKIVVKPFTHHRFTIFCTVFTNKKLTQDEGINKLLDIAERQKEGEK